MTIARSLPAIGSAARHKTSARSLNASVLHIVMNFAVDRRDPRVIGDQARKVLRPSHRHRSNSLVSAWAVERVGLGWTTRAGYWCPQNGTRPPIVTPVLPEGTKLVDQIPTVGTSSRHG